jgi:chromosome segregation ATPase
LLLGFGSDVSQNLRMDGLFLQVSDSKSVKSPQSVSVKKRRDSGDMAKKSGLDSNSENGSVAALSLSGAENKPKDEVAVLREQIDDLQKKLLEKEEALRSAENSVNEMNATYVTIDELRRQVVEKEALIRSTNSQLHDAKVKFCQLLLSSSYIVIY